MTFRLKVCAHITPTRRDGVRGPAAVEMFSAGGPGAQTKRPHCEVRKKNSLFFTTGPPTRKPKILFTNCAGSFRPLADSSDSRGFRPAPLYCSHSAP